MNLTYDDELDRFFPATMPTIVSVRTRDSRTFTDRADSARGTPENPMTHEEIEEKFRRMSGITVDEELSEELRRKVAGLDKLGDINELTELLRFKQ